MDMKNPGYAQSHCLPRWKESLPIFAWRLKCYKGLGSKTNEGGHRPGEQGQGENGQGDLLKEHWFHYSSSSKFLAAWNNCKAWRNNTLSQSVSVGSTRSHFQHVNNDWKSLTVIYRRERYPFTVVCWRWGIVHIRQTGDTLGFFRPLGLFHWLS